MTNKILDDLVTSGVLNRIAQNLKLKQVPTIKYEENDNASYVMIAYGNEWRSKDMFGFSETVTRTSTEYVIGVNVKALKAAQREYFMMCLNPKIMRDITLILLKHECRHLWQYQEQYMVGNTHNIFDMHFNEGHGESKEERDANRYAINTSKGNRLCLAKHVKVVQERKPICYTVSAEEVSACRNVVRAYNPILALFLPKENA